MSNYFLREVIEEADFDPIPRIILGTRDEQVSKVADSLFRSPGSPGETSEVEAFKHAKKLLWGAHQAQPDSQWWLLVEKERQEPVGCCQWRYYTSEKPLGPEGLPFFTATWCPEGDERDFTSAIFNEHVAARRQWMNRPHAELGWFTVVKEHRGRGLSHMLMKIGIDKIDSLGLEAFLEATDHGYHVYTKYGFRSLIRFHVDAEVAEPSKTWRQLQARYPPQSFAAMWRPPNGIWTTDALKVTSEWRDSFVSDPFIRGDIPVWH